MSIPQATIRQMEGLSQTQLEVVIELVNVLSHSSVKSGTPAENQKNKSKGRPIGLLKGQDLYDDDWDFDEDNEMIAWTHILFCGR